MRVQKVFNRNLNNIDRIIRLVLGVGCLYLAFTMPEKLGGTAIAVFIGIFGIINLFAAAMSHCPVYHMTGLSTYSAESKTD